MSQKKLKIFDNTFETYQQKPTRGIYIDTHNEFVKISPAEYTGEAICSRDIKVPRREIYDTILEAQIEAKILKLNTRLLPIGADTHSIKLIPHKIGLTNSFRIDIVLVVDKPNSELISLKNLANKYGVDHFPIGRVPFHNNNMSNAVAELAKNYKHARISSIFKRKRDNYPRVYIGVAMNDFVFGLRSSTAIDIYDSDDHKTEPSPINTKIEFDL